ncbi:MAG: outer membrane beta-barrel domain-containing protein [Archangium sp.]|nr:outer membrane beta-barrel domain-containing protein [Archangium sp.]
MRSLILMVAVMTSASAFAQADELENPGTVSAVQERAYRMQHELNLSLGVLPLDAFYKGYYAQVGYVFHFTDTFAWQVGRGAYAYAARTGLREQLERDFGVLPTAFDEVQFFVGSDLMWKPLYGKLSVMNRWVLHGEMYLLAGASVFRFTNAFRFGPNLGGGARVFINKYASIRFDLTDNIVLPTGGATSLINVMTITLGLGINFGGTE